MTLPVIESNFDINRSIVTFNGSNESQRILPKDIVGLEYSEGLLHEFINVTLKIADSTSGLSDKLFGMERWDIKFTDTINNVTYDFTSGSVNGPLYCYRIHDKIIVDNIKEFTLELCREDAIVSMQKRVCKKYTNIKADQLVADVITKELGNKKKPIISEASANKLSFIPPNSRPLNILIWAKNKYYTNPSGGKFVNAGYFFYETYNNYNYRPIDSVANSNNPLVARYAIGSSPGGSDEIFRLQTAKFTSNIDMIRNFDEGIYSGKIEFFDITTGQMTTKHYSLKDYYPKWNKVTGSGSGGLQVLGSLPLQRDLNPNVNDQQQAVEYDYGTRNMFIGFNKGLFAYSDGDQDVEDSSGFINAVSQSVSRAGLFTNQVLTATSIYGNMSINAGDHIDVNFISSNGVIDKGHSGRYVVFTINHVYIESDKRFKTNYTLVRDSFGV